MSSKANSKFGSFKKLTSGLLSSVGASSAIEIKCRLDGRLIDANETARTIAKTVKAPKVNRLLPDDHFELVSRALHSGDVIVSANSIYGFDFEWKYFLDQRNKAIRIESIKYKQNEKTPIEESEKSLVSESWSSFIACGSLCY